MNFTLCEFATVGEILVTSVKLLMACPRQGSLYSHCQCLRLLQTFAGVLGEKIRMHAILKESMANYISLESLKNVDFGKKYKLPVSSISLKKIANNHENDHVAFN